jgi:hypothetical protein
MRYFGCRGEVTMIKPVLTPQDLEKVAGLCLAAAATTDLDEFGGVRRRQWHHNRRSSFLAASSKLKGRKKLSELGLSEEEMSWAIELTEGDLQERLKIALETMKSVWEKKEQILAHGNCRK